jgi:hypothetical protein
MATERGPTTNEFVVTVTMDTGEYKQGQSLTSREAILGYHRAMVPKTKADDSQLWSIITSVKGDNFDAELERIGKIESFARNPLGAVTEKSKLTHSTTSPPPVTYAPRSGGTTRGRILLCFWSALLIVAVILLGRIEGQGSGLGFVMFAGLVAAAILLLVAWRSYRDETRLDRELRQDQRAAAARKEEQERLRSQIKSVDWNAARRWKEIRFTKDAKIVAEFVEQFRETVYGEAARSLLAQLKREQLQSERSPFDGTLPPPR